VDQSSLGIDSNDAGNVVNRPKFAANAAGSQGAHMCVTVVQLQFTHSQGEASVMTFATQGAGTFF
jgi:hypothetical protein